jgi:hypothetical protein
MAEGVLDVLCAGATGRTSSHPNGAGGAVRIGPPADAPVSANPILTETGAQAPVADTDGATTGRAAKSTSVAKPSRSPLPWCRGSPPPTHATSAPPDFRDEIAGS